MSENDNKNNNKNNDCNDRNYYVQYSASFSTVILIFVFVQLVLVLIIGHLIIALKFSDSNNKDCDVTKTTLLLTMASSTGASAFESVLICSDLRRRSWKNFTIEKGEISFTNNR